MNYDLNHKRFRKHRFGSMIFFCSIAIFIFFFVFLKNFTPFDAKFNYALNDTNSIVSSIGPKTRVKLENGVYIQTDNLIYFTTKMRFHFDEAKVKIIYKSVSPEQELQAGFKNQSGYSYDTKILYSPVINALTWPNIRSDNLMLFQKVSRFNSVKTFLDKPPSDAVIGTYNLSHNVLNQYVILPNYKPSSKKTIIDTPLRGSHTLYVYLDKEPFQMSFYKQDINWYKGEDALNIKIYKDDDLVYEIVGDDDGISDSSKKILPEKKLVVRNPGPELPESGVYKVDINAPGDTIIKKIETNLSKVVFADSIFLAGSREAYGEIIKQTKPQKVYTNAALISALTYHKAGIQNITIDNRNLNLEKVGTTVATKSAQIVSEMIVPKNDVILKGLLGYFAFSRESFFIPAKYIVHPVKTEQDILLVDYLLADYKKPFREGDWQIAEATFDLSSAVIDNDKLGWIIRAPGLKENNREIMIKDIEVQLIKKPWSIFDKNKFNTADGE